MVLIDLDLLNDELEVVPVQLGLGQNVVKDLQRRLGHPVYPDNRVFLVLGQVDLVLDALHPPYQVALQLVVGLLQSGLLLRVFHHVPDPLALGGLQLLLEVQERGLQIFRRPLGLRHVLLLPGQVRVEPVQHGGGVVFHLLHIELYQLVQLVYPDMVAGAALQPPAVVGAAAVGVLDIPAAHGEHGGAAVTALQKAGVGVVVLLLPPVVGGGAALPQGFCRGEGAVVDDGLVVVLQDDVIQLVPAHILAVDLLSGVLPLAEGADVEVVVDDALDRHDGPLWPDAPLVLLARRLLPLPLGHPGGGDALVGEVVGDFFIPPAVDVQLENLPDDLRLGGDDLELLPGIDDVAVGGGAQPFAVLLAAPDHRLYLFAGVGDGHLVDEELELDFQPVVIVGEVDVVPDGDDADARVPQVLQLHQPPAVAAGEAREVLDDEDVLLMAHQFPAHFLIAGPLVEGVARLVPVLVKGQGAVGKLLLDEVHDDGLLVLNGGVVPVQLLVHRDAAVAGNIEFFNHRSHPSDISPSGGQTPRCSRRPASCGTPYRYR